MGATSLIRFTAASVLAAVILMPSDLTAGSCCGGSPAAALLLPKDARSLIELSFDSERYDGYWTKQGAYKRDPPGTDLRQYRLNWGAALRLAERWQASILVPFVGNVNAYPNGTSRSSGPGDSVIGLWYEAFDTPMCRLGWTDIGLSDLVPAATFGFSLTVPTGVSPYDGVASDDITGRGFYRLDGNVLLDKTLFPLTLSLLMTYGVHIERPVNRENEYVEPYRKKLGDRASGTLSASYEQFIDATAARSRMTYTASFSAIREDESTINGVRDPTSGMQKRSVIGSIAWSTLERAWTVKATWNHTIKQDGWGENFPASDIYSLGVTRVFY